MKKGNIKKSLDQINNNKNPRIDIELKGQLIRLLKMNGDFAFHQPENDDEMFLVIKEDLKCDSENEIIDINEGELIIVPKKE